VGVVVTEDFKLGVWNALVQLKTATDTALEVPGLQGQLEPHQRVAIMYAILARKCLLVYSVGLGKTVMSVAADLKLRSMGLVKRSLVLCQSGKRFDWRDEYAQFAPDLRTVLVDGKRSDRGHAWMLGQYDAVTFASYEAARIDLLDKQKLPDAMKSNYYLPSPLLQILKYDLIVFDEVSIFKSWGTVLNMALGYLVATTTPNFTIGLSATPIQKSVDDIFTIVDKVVPGYLGNKQQFDTNFTIKKNICGHLKTVGVQNEQTLSQALAPIFIKRDKDEVYPGRTVHRFKLRRVVLTTEQLDQYEKIQLDTAPDGDRVVLMQQFRLLEQVCDTMAYFDKQCHKSAKIEDLKALLSTELEGEKVVIFSKHMLPLDEVKTQVLEPLGLESIRYTGEERDFQVREAARKRFLTDPNCKIALVSSAAEMGYNFHSAHYIVFLNHIYNPARTAQLIGRIDRPIVQTSDFICSIHYTALGTFEEQIVQKLHREAEIAKTLLGQSNRFDGLKSELVESLSRDDLFALIRNRKVPDRV
jgi:SNF2 family DNA or RNA helicase